MVKSKSTLREERAGEARLRRELEKSGRESRRRYKYAARKRAQKEKEIALKRSKFGNAAVTTFLKNLRATPQVAKAAALRHLSDAEARKELGFAEGDLDLSGVAFPGYDLSGAARGVYQVRRDNPGIDEKGKPKAKYMSPAGSEGRYLYCLPGAQKKLKDPATTVVLVESPKSVIALESFAERTGRKLLAVALNGKDGWKRKTNTQSVPLEDLSLFANRDVLVNLDSNIETNPSVRDSEKSLSGYLLVKVKAKSLRCVRLGPIEEDVNGPDDYLFHHPDKDYEQRLKEAKDPWLYRGSEGATFVSYEDLENSEQPDFLIPPLLQDQGITGIGGLSGHGKTWILLSIIKALLSGEKLFGHFEVKKTVPRVLYLSPEVQRGQIKIRLRRLGLMNYVKDGRLLVRSLSEGRTPKLVEPDILMAARGAVVVLDTAIRFMEGKENAAESNRDGLSTKCFGLLEAGAQTIIAAYHSPKDLENAKHLTLQNTFRGTGDIGAVLSGAWGVFQINDDSNSIYVANLKPRDQEKFGPFVITGDPFINREGDFKVTASGAAVKSFAQEKSAMLPSGRKTRPETEDKRSFIRDRMISGEKSPTKITAALNAQFGTKHGKGTVSKWIKECTENAPNVKVRRY